MIYHIEPNGDSPLGSMYIYAYIQVFFITVRLITVHHCLLTLCNEVPNWLVGIECLADGWEGRE